MQNGICHTSVPGPEDDPRYFLGTQALLTLVLRAGALDLGSNDLAQILGCWQSHWGEEIRHEQYSHYKVEMTAQGTNTSSITTQHMTSCQINAPGRQRRAITRLCLEPLPAHLGSLCFLPKPFIRNLNRRLLGHYMFTKHDGVRETIRDVESIDLCLYPTSAMCWLSDLGRVSLPLKLCFLFCNEGAVIRNSHKWLRVQREASRKHAPLCMAHGECRGTSFSSIALLSPWG